jgi:[pyruvate, water dikinase]-phosphate phosphotransferase / [pyruvate, water dikinase] kinase
MTVTTPIRQHSRPIFVVSGGAGTSGELLLRTVLAQFPGVQAPVTLWPQIHTPAQVDELILRAQQDQAIIVHTLVNAKLRHLLALRAATHQIVAVDLVGPLIDHLGRELQESPLGEPGRYRALRNGYFRRIEAIEFAVTHDDGQRIDELSQAEIVLIGVSRVGKTPLSIYLSLQGWKVANIPIIAPDSLPAPLRAIPPSRVVALTIEPKQLVIFRRTRQPALGISGGSYVDLAAVAAEVRAANHLFAHAGYTIIDITDKPIETSSEEVVATISAQAAGF